MKSEFLMREEHTTQKRRKGEKEKRTEEEEEDEKVQDRDLKKSIQKKKKKSGQKPEGHLLERNILPRGTRNVVYELTAENKPQIEFGIKVIRKGCDGVVVLCFAVEVSKGSSRTRSFDHQSRWVDANSAKR